ncbi:MAG: phosphoenolpyruvate--protein phosphotransferase [Deltaproteobacteria bacterium]|nr:phosphoenolpyruvate--protein phosphotransferase [Deltaproteobacteria bacterium]
MAFKSAVNVKLNGVGVSPGIALGKAFVVDRGVVEISLYSLGTEQDIEKEIAMFLKAIESTRNQLQETKKKFQEKGHKEANFIIGAYLMILEDKILVDETVKHIRREKINAPWALKNTLKNLQKVFSDIDDEYLRERKNDIDYVGKRILWNLMKTEQPDMKKMQEKVIIVASDLSPTDTAHLDLNKVLGFVTNIGGQTSHTAIMAKALEIPAVVGLQTVTECTENGDDLVVDGTAGTVIINPSKKVFNEYIAIRKKYHTLEKELLKYKPLPTKTPDGIEVKLLANIEITEELPSVIHHGAEGIGLYRTEFLYTGRSEFPSEDDHFHIYRKVVETIAPNPTTIRTFDLGGDKFLSETLSTKEMNPALGLRAIRFCLREIEVFKTQIRAILRASALGKVRILFPMISNMEEMYQIDEIMEEVKNDLRTSGVPFDESIETGIMIETPSAAVIADLLAKKVNFFSIGTNDLIQYLLAIDRINEHVSYLYKPLHPAVLRMIKHIIDTAHAAHIKVNMCGEMAGEGLFTPILLGFGIDELSMNALSILKVKKIIRSFSYHDAQDLVNQILAFETAKEVEKFLINVLSSRYPKLFPELQENPVHH